MFPLVPEVSTDPVVRPVFERLRQRWGKVLNLYRILAWSPELVQSWAAFAWSMRFDLKVSRRSRELLVIRIADLLGATYEYGHHLPMAREAGVSDEQIAALPDWRRSALFGEEDRAVLALADDLAALPGAKQETMAQLRRAFDERQCVELLVTGSFYCGVARIVNSAQVELEDDHSDLRARND